MDQKIFPVALLRSLSRMDCKDFGLAMQSNMIRIVPTQAIELGTFEYVKRAMTATQEKWKESECPKMQIGPLCFSLSLSWVSPIAIAGAAAGIASTLVCHPLEVLKVLSLITISCRSL